MTELGETYSKLFRLLKLNKQIRRYGLSKKFVLRLVLVGLGASMQQCKWLLKLLSLGWGQEEKEKLNLKLIAEEKKEQAGWPCRGKKMGDWEATRICSNSKIENPKFELQELNTQSDSTKFVNTNEKIR